MAPLSPLLRSLPKVLTVSCTAIGALVLAGILVATVTPLLIGVTALVAWLGILVLLAWLGIEALAALERWFETDRRFLR